MLGKVLKYDIKSMGKSLFPLYLAILITAIVIRCFGFLAESFGVFKIINDLITGLFIVLLIGTFFYTFFVAIKRYYKNLYADESYLTHTLPVKVDTLLSSKVITSLIYIIVSSITVTLGLLIAMDMTAVIALVKVFLQQATIMFETQKLTIIIFGLLFMLLGYMTYVFMAYAGISLGQSHSNNKIVFSIVYCIALYYIGQIIMLIFLGIMMLSSPELITNLNNNTTDADAAKNIMLFALGADALLCIAYYVICHNRLKNLNLQ